MTKRNEELDGLSELVTRLTVLIKHIQDALGTAEQGDALVEVARNAHRAEQELAGRLRAAEMEEIEHRQELKDLEARDD